MRTRQLIAVALLLLWASASRSPAPIIEEQQSPPTTEQSSKQKVRRRATTPKTDSSQTKSRNPAATLQGPARFAGIWTGEIKQGLLGRVTASFTVSPDAVSVQMSQNMGGGTHPATMNGNTLSWSTGTFSATANLTPNSDGQTAQFLLKGMFGSTTSTMRRAAGFTPTTSSSNSQTPPPITQPNANTPGYDTVALRPSGSMSGPKPELPPELHGQNLTGRGVYLMHFDKPTGNLIDVTVSQSTGSTILDQAAIATLRQWHATPGCPREVPFTVTYSVTGP